MSRFLAIVFLILFIWFAIPHLLRGEWFAPDLGPKNHWAYEIAHPDTQNLLAKTPDGFGLYRFDFWNKPEKNDGRQITENDLKLQKFWK